MKKNLILITFEIKLFFKYFATGERSSIYPRFLSLTFHAWNVWDLYISHIAQWRISFSTRERFKPILPRRADASYREMKRWDSEGCAEVCEDASSDDKEARNPWRNWCCTWELYLREKSLVHASRDLLSGQRGESGEKDFAVLSRGRALVWKWHWCPDAAEAAGRTSPRSWRTRMTGPTGAISNPWAIPAARATWRVSTSLSSSRKSTPLPGATAASMLELFTFWSITAVRCACTIYMYIPFLQKSP